ncbi:glycine zipper 2TM domain-containing protein [Massilia sp. B-10]|nr:glycine zipper 2TM domain-containing protein [Massilia sp. B-10]
MKTLKQCVMSASLAAAVLGLTACAGMSQQDKNTAVGATAGAVIGGVLTGSSTALSTVGGAAVGGVIGNQVKPPK